MQKRAARSPAATGGAGAGDCGEVGSRSPPGLCPLGPAPTPPRLMRGVLMPPWTFSAAAHCHATQSKFSLRARIVTFCIVTPPSVSPSSPANVSPLHSYCQPLYWHVPPYCDWGGDSMGMQPV
eukprot:4926617-Pyramimonas_sp.AAC.2